MADNKVKFLRGSSNEYKSTVKDNDTFYYTTDDEKLYLGNKEITGGGVTIDDTLSDTSENPVQNKVINAALNNKADQTAVDSALAQKANSADVTASLARKSDTEHTHDDRYYTETEVNNLLSNKVEESSFNSHANNTTAHVTAEDKAKWNAVNYSNPNLLINPDFRINQRGQSSWAGAGYTVDRWYKKLASDTTIYLNDDGSLHVPAKTIFLQCMPIDDYKKLVGKTLTFTVKYSGEAPVWVSFVAPAPPADISYRIHPDADRFWITTYEDRRLVECRYYDPTADHDIEWVKLELGNISTPFCPPDPATELAKCQRYYQIRSTGDIDLVDLRPTMATITDIKQRSDGNYEYIAEL